MNKDLQIPFDSKGNQMHYPENWYGLLTWKKNAVYDGELQITEMQRGRSAAYFVGTLTPKGPPDIDKPDEIPAPFGVTIFMKDFLEMVRTSTIERGRLLGYFTFAKRGQNYGCRLFAPGAE